MNFLAHLVLAPQTPEGLIGSIAPDMIKGPLPKDLHPAVMVAAKEHHRIDRFTDAHHAFAQTRDRLSGLVGMRLSGILADVLYDHILARDWLDWRSEAFLAYLSHTEGSLVEALPKVPVRMQMIVRKMIDEQWLRSYATVDGIRARLETMSTRLSRRLDRPISLVISNDELSEQQELLTADFSQLWPDLLAHVDDGRGDQDGRLAS